MVGRIPRGDARPGLGGRFPPAVEWRFSARSEAHEPAEWDALQGDQLVDPGNAIRSHGQKAHGRPELHLGTLRDLQPMSKANCQVRAGSEGIPLAFYGSKRGRDIVDEQNEVVGSGRRGRCRPLLPDVNGPGMGRLGATLCR